MKRPLSVKILMVLYLISAIIAGLIGIILLSGTIAISQVEDIGQMALPFGIMFGTAGIVFLIVATFNGIMYYGMKNQRNWARILVLIAGIIGVISGIINLKALSFVIILSLIWNGYIIYALGFDKKTKEYFK